jgi:hypothetical protein
MDFKAVNSLDPHKQNAIFTEQNGQLNRPRVEYLLSETQSWISQNFGSSDSGCLTHGCSKAFDKNTRITRAYEHS